MKTDFAKFPSIGGSNGYSMVCKEVHVNGGPSRASYSVCQHVILAVKDKRLPAGSFQSCAEAIRAGKCQAVGMMMEELKVGQRIYYVDRLEEMRKIREEMERGSKEPDTSFRRGSVFGTRYVPKPSTKESAPLVDIYAEALNAEAKTTKENT